MMSGNLVAAHDHYANVFKESPSNKEAVTALGQIRTQLMQKPRQEAADRLQNSGVQTAPALRSYPYP